jgi:hypothetical protein
MVNDMTGDKDDQGRHRPRSVPPDRQGAGEVHIYPGRQGSYRGRPIYRVSFRPKPHEEDADWKGEALIDAAECQPVVVNTKLA